MLQISKIHISEEKSNILDHLSRIVTLFKKMIPR